MTLDAKFGWIYPKQHGMSAFFMGIMAGSTSNCTVLAQWHCNNFHGRYNVNPMLIGTASVRMARET